MEQAAIIARVYPSVSDIPREAWNALWAVQAQPTPFTRHEYLQALEDSGSAVPRTGWTPAFMALWDGETLAAACPMYLKTHSYGEYVFDWAWADAYARHGLDYYPKALIAVPFTPVPGSRLLARSAALRAHLLSEVQNWCAAQGLSSAHLLFGDAHDQQAAQACGWMQRHTVQFHWNATDARPTALPPCDFDAWLSLLSQDKRKKIRQERRKVADAGVRFRSVQGSDITPQDWAFFYRCYERTYLEHGNPPYLRPAFFDAMARDMPEHWLMFIAEREGRPIAASLIGLQGPAGKDLGPAGPPQVAYGRYWGALERVDSLHFEACYYQPLQWCLAHGVTRFEGGAQGEHKMARALLPAVTSSHHWLAHPAFAHAVQQFLGREGDGIEAYLDHLQARSPYRSMGG